MVYFCADPGHCVCATDDAKARCSRATKDMDDAEEITWTDEEFREFASLVADINASGFNNPRRPIGRTHMNAFVAKHGKAKCDAMFAKLEKDGK